MKGGVGGRTTAIEEPLRLAAVAAADLPLLEQFVRA